MITKKLIVAALGIGLVLVGCKNNTSNTDNNSAANGNVQSAQNAAAGVATGVAYISMDSLMAKFNLATELRAALETKVQKADREITNKGKRLEADMMDYQEKVTKGLITRAQAAEMEQKLSTQQQNFMRDRERLMGELSEEEAVMTNRVYHFIMDYLKAYNSDYRYSMIISTTSAGPILHADPALDITADVLKGLNEKYAQEKPASKNK